MSDSNGQITIDGQKLMDLIMQQTKLMDTHIRRFDRHLQDWNVHRSESKNAMSKVSAIHDEFLNLARCASHLTQLPVIAQTLTSIQSGLMSQNGQLILQNDGLIKPATKAQAALSNIVLVMIFLMAASMFIVLMRGSNLDFNVFGDKGVSIRGRSAHPPIVDTDPGLDGN